MNGECEKRCTNAQSQKAEGKKQMLKIAKQQK